MSQTEDKAAETANSKDIQEAKPSESVPAANAKSEDKKAESAAAPSSADDGEASSVSDTEAPGDDSSDSSSDDEISQEALNMLLKQVLSGQVKPQPPPMKILESATLEAVAKGIKEGKFKNIICMTGAGISVAAGIPDFRSPGTGLYSNLQKYNLPFPEAVFEINFFRENPNPFFTLAKELYPGLFNATKCHYFIRLLHDKGLLLRNFTQNIDTLEVVAGIPEDKLVFAHGSFSGAHCIDCKAGADIHHVKTTILAGNIPRCDSCKTGLVKPDIVFFGESLPPRFFDLSSKDFDKCDLLLILGTSLTVQPFAGLINRVGRSVPRVLINREKVGQGDPRLMALGMSTGLNFNEAIRDVAVLGDLQGNIEKFAELLGWSEDLSKMVEEGTKTFKDELAKAQAEANTAKAATENSSSVSSTPSAAPSSVVAESQPASSPTKDSSNESSAPAPAPALTATPEPSKPNL